MITPLTEVGLFCYFIYFFWLFLGFFLFFFWRGGGGYLGGWELTNTVLDPGFVERGGAKRPGAHHVFKIFLDTFISYSS